VKAVQAVESLKRVPPESRQSFFGRYDVWRYEGIADDVLCEDCLKHLLDFYYLGNELRGNFKYLEIINANLIEPRIHPNCRCRLHRVTKSHEYLAVLQHYA